MEAFKQSVIEVNKDFHNIDVENITEFYLRNVSPNDSEAIKSRISDFFGDLLMKCPTYLFAKRYAEHSSDKTKVFFYELTHASGSEAVYHAADVLFVFGLPLIGADWGLFSEEDKQISKIIIQYWTHFAKHGYYNILQ